MYRLIVLLFLSGCSAVVPPWIQVRDTPYEYHEVLRAVSDFESEWQSELAMDIGFALEDATITFEGKPESEWNASGCIRGLVSPYDQDNVTVFYVNDKEWPIHQTAFWHELTHVVLWDTEGDPDYDHGVIDGPWTNQHDDIISTLKEVWREE